VFLVCFSHLLLPCISFSFSGPWLFFAAPVMGGARRLMDRGDAVWHMVRTRTDRGIDGDLSVLVFCFAGLLFWVVDCGLLECWFCEEMDEVDLGRRAVLGLVLVIKGCGYRHGLCLKWWIGELVIEEVVVVWVIRGCKAAMVAGLWICGKDGWARF
jgi:hypothetical protein